jgi:putative membrane protein
MTRAAAGALTAGVLLFIAVLVSQRLPAVMATLSLAGWGLLLVALFHSGPLLLDAASIRVLFRRGAAGGCMRNALLTRWAGESANSLLPAGLIGGPVLMVRHLNQRGLPLADAAAAITVSTTLQAFAQISFALLGVMLLGAQAPHISHTALRTSSLIASGVLALQVGGFYLLQRRGLFSRLMRTANRFSGKRDWSQLMIQAQVIDLAVQDTYTRAGPVAASFFLSLVAWLVGTGEVYIILTLFGHPVSWSAALVLEGLGQAIRGAAFAIPGALGVQEGGYLLLAPLVGLAPGMGLALSLAKRSRELLLGLPGLLFLHFSERAGSAAAKASAR